MFTQALQLGKMSNGTVNGTIGGITKRVRLAVNKCYIDCACVCDVRMNGLPAKLFIAGPSQWGSRTHMLQPTDVWRECQRGRRQSPVNMTSDLLVFDPSLGHLQWEGDQNAVNFSLACF